MEMFSPQGVNDPTNPLYQSGEGIIDKILEQASPAKRLSESCWKRLFLDQRCQKVIQKNCCLIHKEM